MIPHDLTVLKMYRIANLQKFWTKIHSEPDYDGSSTRGGSTSVRRQVHSPHVAKLQAACVSIGKGSCAPGGAAIWDRRVDTQTDRRVAVSLNPSTYGGSIITVTEDGMVGLYLIAISTNNLQLRDLVVSFLAYCTTLLYYLAIQPFKAASVFK